MEELDVMMVPDDSSRGYIIECDLGKYYFYYLYIYVHFIKCNVFFLCISEYTHELHDLHKDYSLVPACLQKEENILSDYQHHLLQDEGFSKPSPKLVPNLRNKTNCIIDYRNLKLHVELGLRLTNVHRDLPFNELPWLKNVINFSTCQRPASKNDLKKISLSWWTTRSFVSLFYFSAYLDLSKTSMVFTTITSSESIQTQRCY